MNREFVAFLVLLAWLLVMACVEFVPRPTSICKCGVACECGDQSTR